MRGAPMEMDKIMQHWKSWAKEHKTDLKATTKTSSIKKLEILALSRAFRKMSFVHSSPTVLEVGCGNGHNCFQLFDFFPNFSFTGVDFVSEMVQYARTYQASTQQYAEISFYKADVLSLTQSFELKKEYDVVFTDRCLINLNSYDLQEHALGELIKKTSYGGYVVLIENIAKTYSQQNLLREAVGLKPRIPDQYNLFLDESRFLPFAQKSLKLLDVQTFASLHDIILYVIVPMINDGFVDYNSPMVEAVTKLLLSTPEDVSRSFGHFGQNRLYLFQKEFYDEK